MREAVFRNAILAGQMKEDAAAQQLAQPVETYEIVVAGPDMKPFQSVDEKILQNGAFLMDRKTKQKITPTSVKIQNSEDGKKIQSVAFVFPKKSDSGISTIGDDVKVVDFLCVVTNVKIEASFDTSKMADTQGRDL
jgi:transposase